MFDSSESTNRIARRYNGPSDEEVRFNLRNKRGIAQEEGRINTDSTACGSRRQSAPARDAGDRPSGEPLPVLGDQVCRARRWFAWLTACSPVVLRSDEEKMPQRREFSLC